MLAARASTLRSAGRFVSVVGIGSYGVMQGSHHMSSPPKTLAEGTTRQQHISDLGRHPTCLVVHTIDIIFPTLEATVRVIRLLKTAALIAVDYKTADWFSTTLDDDASYWEKEVTRRLQVLDEAQNIYTKDSHSELDKHLRLEAKAHEKKAMQDAAKDLTFAQEQLSLHPSNSSRIHRKAANRLLKLCHENKGVYIKVGQHLAQLDYLVPDEYTQVLSALFDNNPRTSYDQVRLVVRQDLNQDIDELWDNFDPEPIASASLAQVHVAYDKATGKKLAVKIQHYGLRETSAGDLFALVNVVRQAERLFDGFTWGWLADEIAPHLPKELDFINEGRNAERAAGNLKQTGNLACVVPKILWEQSSSRVLTMEFEEGFNVTDVDAIRKAGLRERDVARLVSAVFGSQVFLSGAVHCDPHPANVLLRANKGKPEIVLLDHGLYRELDPDFRLRYANLWQSLMLADLDGIKAACRSLNVESSYPLFAAMLTARPFDEMIERSKRKSLRQAAQAGDRADQAVIRNYAQRYMADIFELLGTLPRQMLLLLKMNDCLRHIDYKLGSPTNTLVVSGAYAARAVYESKIYNTNVSWADKWMAWWDYVRVLFRVRLHDTTAWLLQI
ncbi:hypothetical protein MPSEU_000919900 [Mayamaea pseudoterrestris]|nr:hypothetical protein MPSEU_000919900 [Mayamaea pseudoterrestris]